MTNYEIKQKLKEDLETYGDKRQIVKDLSEMTGYSHSWVYRYWHSYSFNMKIENAAIELLKRYKREALARIEKIERAKA